MKINPFNNSNPMSWQDATKVSAVLAVAAFFTVFLLPYTYSAIKLALGDFIFNAICFFGSSFFTNFVVLAGLTQLTKKKAEE